MMHMALQPGACRYLLTRPTREDIKTIAAFPRLEHSTINPKRVAGSYRHESYVMLHANIVASGWSLVHWCVCCGKHMALVKQRASSEVPCSSIIGE